MAVRLRNKPQIVQAEEKKTKTILTAMAKMNENGGERFLKVDFDEDWLEDDSEFYNHQLGQFCAKFSLLGYSLPIMAENEVGEKVLTNRSNVLEVLEEFGFDDVCYESQTAVDQVNYFIANKKIGLGKNEITLVFAGFIGSYVGQWYTNFESGTGNVHKGFNNAKNFAYEKLRKYIERLDLSAESTKLLLTGHSRGAATANMLSAQLIKEEIYAKKENIYTYTFATPSGTKLRERYDAKYKRIFNVLNDEDFVTKCMPAVWGYGRYGTTLAFPQKSNTKKYKMLLKNVEKLIFDLCGKNYAPFKNGAKTADKLVSSMAEYLATVDDFYNKKFKSQGEKISVQEYFTRTLCAIVGEEPGSEKTDIATKYMLGTFLNRATSSPVIRAVANFFVLYEGIGSATTGKISDTYFAYSHMPQTYCAFMMETEKDDLTLEISLVSE